MSLMVIASRAAGGRALLAEALLEVGGGALLPEVLHEASGGALLSDTLRAENGLDCILKPLQQEAITTFCAHRIVWAERATESLMLLRMEKLLCPVQEYLFWGKLVADLVSRALGESAVVANPSWVTCPWGTCPSKSCPCVTIPRATNPWGTWHWVRRP